MKKLTLALPLAMATMATTGYAQLHDGNAKLTDIQAQFVYEKSGTLSDDLTKRENMVSWNAPIGDGPDGENANDLLISVIFTADEQGNSTKPLSIVVRGKGGKVLARRISANILFETTTRQFVYLQDASCDGEITIDASYGRQKLSEKLIVECGE